ncbi:MAG TPA: bifunctional hydroxymethylpyrimidine kinase/phosphomethylpyrimidine kinase [bacterium]|nr:bifunctional hydroxymethylpyrimidine kinase/phosphomethylpyrimidine kinase [bacterium]
MSEKPVILIISGIDPTNGAGLGRDIITVRDNGGFPVSAPSTLTVQNSMNFEYYQEVDIKYLRDCLESLEKEFSFSAVKTGLLPLNGQWIRELSEILQKFTIPVVIDTVFKASSSQSDMTIIPDSYTDLIRGANKIITPNLKELELIHLKLTGKKETQKKMAKYVSDKLSCSVVTTFEGRLPVISITTNGSSIGVPITLYEPDRKFHGTGCTFSSALATNLAKGENLTDSVKNAADHTLEKVKKAILFNELGQYFL